MEHLVPWFYREIGQNLIAWRKPAPTITQSKATAEDVDIEAIERAVSDDDNA